MLVAQEDTELPSSTWTASRAPSDLSEKHQPPHKPDILFPITNKRKFASHWYKQFPWLEYSAKVDSVFCKPCRFFTKNSKADDAFTHTGFNKWKNIGEKCTKHSESATHKTADESWKMYRNTLKVGRVDQQLDPEFKDNAVVTLHEEHIRTVLDIILFLAQQELAFRGDDETIDSLNRGNFLELFDFICKYDPIVKERFDKLPANSKLISPDIQNELLEASKQELLDIIRSEVRKATKYAILADEVKDASKRELLGVSLRYVLDGRVKERVIGIIELES